MYHNRANSHLLGPRAGAWWLAVLVLVVGLGVLPFESTWGSEHDRARAAVRSGAALPLSQVVGPLRQRFNADVLDARLRPGPNGALRYDIKMLRRAGQVILVTVDARSGQVVGVR